MDKNMDLGLCYYNESSKIPIENVIFLIRFS